MTAMKKRIEWIDIAKGIGITLVSFGHLRNGDGQSVWLPALDSLIAAIYLFHMPLFFLLGGITFSMGGMAIPQAEN
ncbi:Acyltransferase [Bifidobacterium thermophilum]|uniref:Acyltransferase n=2 Tax=Bifidobacterium thermophilum TaxID=33905 RepID=A0A2N3QPB5_9BIFI|nr:Acyltransferase [Bifidobacterium thermophilum]